MFAMHFTQSLLFVHGVSFAYHLCTPDSGVCFYTSIAETNWSRLTILLNCELAVLMPFSQTYLQSEYFINPLLLLCMAFRITANIFQVKVSIKTKLISAHIVILHRIVSNRNSLNHERLANARYIPIILTDIKIEPDG